MSTPAPTPTNRNKIPTTAAAASSSKMSSAEQSTTSSVVSDNKSNSDFSSKLNSVMNGRFDAGSVFKFMSTVIAETSAILLKFNPADFENFGLMNSHIYRNAFVRLVNESELGPEEFIIIIAMFTAVKSKPRVERAMERFKNEKWFKKVQLFIQEKIVQYTSELDEEMSTFAAVHIPNIMPSITALCWIKITKPELVTPDNLLRNLWACQLDIPPAMKEEQKIWEKDFWTSKVTHTKNQNLNKKRDQVTLGFHEDFWKTKSQDTYPLIMSDGNAAKIETKEDLKKFLEHWLAKSV